MIPPEIIQFIRAEVARAANVILTAKAKTAVQSDDGPSIEDIEGMFVNTTTIEKRAGMHPYGFASRAKAGTMSVIARQGSDPANRVVLGHRDAEQPELEAEGEVMIYNSHGEQIYLKSGKVIIKGDAIEVGDGATKEAARKGDQVKVTIPAGTFIISVSGGSGAPAVGVPNPAPVDVTGTIQAGSGTVKIKD